MCGINGIILKKNNHGTRLAQALESMNKALTHRGPDDEGFFLANDETMTTAAGDDTPKVVLEHGSALRPITHIQNLKENFIFGFGHRRLSILDLSPAGHQPMCNIHQDLWITYNGEIYNYLEIKTELKNLGHQFRTETDTEVILYAYSQWGQDCVNRFEGMWALVIYDAKKKEFFGSRDRMGVKPFYYYNGQNAFAFASEQKALATQPFVKTGINHEAVYDFFVLNEIEYQEEGMFSNIMELPPSHSFTFSLRDNDFKKWKYYELQANTEFNEFNTYKASQYEEELSNLLENAVKLRLRSDVPVGACLSGGIDSSTLTGIMQQQNMAYPLKLFTASFEDKNIDESPWAKKMAGHPNSRWERVFPSSGELLKDLEHLLYSQDIPIWSTSTYAQYRVMKLARESGTKVVLSGQGGDELFAGYPVYLYPYLRELLKTKSYKSFFHTLSSFGSTRGNVSFFLKQSFKTFIMGKFPETLAPYLLKKSKEELPYLNPDFFRAHAHRLARAGEENENSLNGALLRDLDNRLLKKYLKCEDRCGMAHSVESRIPFSDSRPLIEFALTIPSSYKIHDGFQKYILRKAASRFIPREIALRKDKMGYVTPNNQWIAEIFPEIKEIFEHPLLKDFINKDKVLSPSSNFANPGKMGINSMAFKFISFACWIKAFESALRK